MTVPFSPFGEEAVRFPIPEDLDRAGTFARLRALPGVIDVVFAERHGVVRFVGEPPRELASALVRRVGGPPGGREVVIRARYDGLDLAAMAAWAGISADEVVRRHTGRVYEVRFLGFLPGFAYLGEVDPSIAVPRRAAPRPRVPAGAVGVAGRRTAVYPSDSPGGWNVVATALDFVAFDLVHGAALAPGDRVRFEPA